jgi:hypothetical protein
MLLRTLFFLLILAPTIKTQAQVKTIHVYVALCDNKYQGIVPVPAKIGNGQDPRLNLYWGAGYGVKSFFKLKTKDWVLVKELKSTNKNILERVLFKHAIKEVYLLADAYDGQRIKPCIEDFLKTAHGWAPVTVEHDSLKLSFGGGADLAAYLGHDGLMEFDADVSFTLKPTKKKDVIVLGCYSREYFSPYIKEAGANPILWTTHLMAPEAYTLKAAIDGWILNETGAQIDERAAQAYHKYQNCGIKGARNLFTTGFKQ